MDEVGAKSEQQTLLDTLSVALKQIDPNDFDTIQSLNDSILSCLQHVLLGSLRVSEFIRVVREIFPDNSSMWLNNGILSCLWILASQSKSLIQQNPEAAATATPLGAILKDLITSDLVDANSLKSTMELSSLIEGGVLKEEEQAVQKRIIKINTGLVYKQQKYNLLREETEGYSKLMLVLNNVSNYQNEEEGALNHGVQLYTESILGIIGQFDLDPNRVFDIILDAFEQQPSNSTFVDILKRLRPTNLVHTLGFKFLHYHEKTLMCVEKPAAVTPAATPTAASAAAAKSEDNAVPALDILPTPFPLLEVTATLIISGLVKLEDLIPYLQPSVEETKNAIQKTKDTVDNCISESKLDVKTNKTIVSMKSILKGGNSGETISTIHTNQVIGLLTALIRFHGWEDAKALVSLIGLPIDLIVRYVEPVRKALIVLFIWKLDGLRQHYGFDAVLTDSSLRHAAYTIPTISSKQVTQLDSLDDLLDGCWDWIEHLQFQIAEDSKLFSKLCRLLKAYLAQNGLQLLAPDNAEGFKNTREKLMKVIVLMLQALSISGNDSTYFSAQLWQVISVLPFQERFALYEVWKEGGSFTKEKSRPAIVESIENFALAFVRSQMKRLAKENAKQIGQKLSKFMHANPIMFIQHVLNQVENFDNLIPYIVEAMKYSTDLSRDVFAACILLQLKRTEQDTKIKEGDTHYVQWFAALSKFIGTFYCKYPNTEIKGLFSYLLQSLSNGNASDLLLLKDMLSIMGGCETLLEVSPTQLEGLGGGKVLRAEAMNLASSVAMSGNKNLTQALPTKRSSVVLREELISSGAAMPMLLFIAQIRSNVLFESSNRHLKLISHFYDTAQDLMMQYADFLIGEAKSIDAIAKLMPEFRVLLEEVGLSTPIAFQLVRPLLRYGLQQMKNITETTLSSSKKIWHPFHNNIVESIKAQSTEEGSEQHLSVKLNIYFWTLSVYDISVPTDRYQTEIKTIKDRLADLESKKGTTTAASLQMNGSEFSKWCKQRDADIKQMNQTINALSEELLLQKKHVEKVRETLTNEKDGFFLRPPEDSITTLSATELLLQTLVLKRVLMSPIDAVYCIRFCKLIFDLEVPGFCLFDFFDKFISRILPLIFASTETEAKFIGHALTEIFLILNPWYCNQELFNLENQGKTITFAELLDVNPADNTKVLSHTKFQTVYKKWHSKILDIVMSGLNGKEFMYIRSALVLLSKVSLQFPFIKSEGLKLLQRIKKLEADEEEREDLQLMAKSVYIVITRHSISWLDDVGPLPSSKEKVKRSSSVSKNTSDSSSKGKTTKEAESSRGKESEPSRGGKDYDANRGKRKAADEEVAPPNKLPRPSNQSHSQSRNSDSKDNNKSNSSASSNLPSRVSDNDLPYSNQKGNYSGNDRDRERDRDRRGPNQQSSNSGRGLLGNPVSHPPNLSTPQYGPSSGNSNNNNSNNSSNNNYQQRGNNNYHSNSGGSGNNNYHNQYHGHDGYHNQGHYDNPRYQDNMRHDYDSNYNRHSRNDGYQQGNNRMSRGNYNDGPGVNMNNANLNMGNSGGNNNNNNNSNKRQRK